MGRAAIALGTQGRCSCVVDRSVDGLLFTDERRNGSAAPGLLEMIRYCQTLRRPRTRARAKMKRVQKRK